MLIGDSGVGKTEIMKNFNNVRFDYEWIDSGNKINVFDLMYELKPMAPDAYVPILKISIADTKGLKDKDYKEGVRSLYKN